MTISAQSSTITHSSVFVQKYSLLLFFLLVYVLTWPFMILEVLESFNLLSFHVPTAFLIIQAFMPGVAAIIMAGVVSGKTGIRALLGKLLIAKVEFKWYAFAIFALAIVSLLAILLNNVFMPSKALPLLSTKMPPMSGPAELMMNIVLLFIFSIIFNAEEIGWRGFALPKLQGKYNAFTSSLILSIPWLFFHLPLFFKIGSSQADSSFLSYAIGIMALSVLFTWVYNNTKGSVFLAAILHASSNTWTQIFSINSDATNHFLGWMMTAVLVILAIIVVVASGAKNLSRTQSRIQE